ncbi:Pro-MCH [Oryzias melastigma]|uniref:Pro-MCH n=1 Tax=Oryzias melastigma TaxID=30732 RepID=A0A834F689_ORYME|nr:Pro-MCH [Oryzias melastigma]
MMSACSVLFTLVLFSELNGRLVTVALPSSSAEDAAADRVGLDGVLDDDSMLKPAIIRPTYRRSLTLDDNVKDEESPQLVIISDMRLKGRRFRGLNSAFARRLAERSPGDYSMNVDRRDDLNMLRCMIGRVYRPCWSS